MNGEIRDPDPADDDIPVLTDIVVPGRLRAELPPPAQPQEQPPEFVFDIDFAATPQPGDQDQGYDFRAPPLPAQPWSEPAPDVPAVAAASAQEDDLPLPWAGARAPEQVETESASPLPLAEAAEPPSPVAVAEPPDPDAQALLRVLLAEIGNGLERRLAHEMTLTEQRLRTALREELDRKLSELLAGTPPTA